MREKRTVLVCPKCNQISLDYAMTNGVLDFYICTACGWFGSEAVFYEFWQEKVTRIAIEHSTIDRIVYLYYGHSDGEFKMPNFEMVANGEWYNDTCYQFTVNGKINEYDEDDAEEFRRSGKPGDLSNGAVLNILCADGWLEPGDYIVEVCW